jgi:hypothetical protein
MDKELDEKLVKNHPLLYSDRQGDVRSTCMVWGFACGNGWFDLIWDLSQKLEPLIKEFKKENPDLDCETCGCPRDEHYGCKTYRPGTCMAVKLKWIPGPLKGRTVYASDPKWKCKLNRLYNKAVNVINSIIKWPRKLFPWNYQACYCTEYRHPHPRAAQVKEKFGTLRFYMTHATEEMFELIEAAEAESEHTCESCGEPGEIGGQGWVSCLCEKCRNETK